MLGEIWDWVSRMRFLLPVRRAILLWLPSAASRIEFLAARYSWRFSSAGRSLATAMSIPNTVETSASSPSRTSTVSRRIFFRRRLGAAGAPPFSEVGCGPAAGLGRRVGVRGSCIGTNPGARAREEVWVPCARCAGGDLGSGGGSGNRLRSGYDGGGSLALGHGPTAP